MVRYDSYKAGECGNCVRASVFLCSFGPLQLTHIFYRRKLTKHYTFYLIYCENKVSGSVESDKARGIKWEKLQLLSPPLRSTTLQNLPSEIINTVRLPLYKHIEELLFQKATCDIFISSNSKPERKGCLRNPEKLEKPVLNSVFVSPIMCVLTQK